MTEKVLSAAPRPMVGAIEAGGTKFVCAVGTGPDDLRAQTRLPTMSPSETLKAALDFLTAQVAIHGPLDAIGVGCFGPADIRSTSSSWGRITTTPKSGWCGADVTSPFQNAFEVPVGFDTDVNGAVLAEWLWGAGRGVDNVVYITVGTGIGGGVLAEGRLIHGLWHPEIGHLLVPREEDDVSFEGSCPYHGGACLEGLAAGPAISARWGAPGYDLPSDHPAWDLESRYLATLCVNLTLSISPQRIIVGGGVMQQSSLLPRIHAHVRDRLQGYLPGLAAPNSIESLIVSPELGNRVGICGAVALGLNAFDAEQKA